MKRFVSRLQTLERLRQQQEKLAALEMAEKERLAEASRIDLRMEQEARQRAFADTASLLLDAAAGGQLQAGRTHIKWRDQRVVEQEARVAEAEVKSRQATERRTSAWKDLRVVEEAGQREREAYRQLQQAEHLAELVDRASLAVPQQDSSNEQSDPSRSTDQIVTAPGSDEQREMES